MNIETLTQYFIQYGAFFIFLIVLLEYMNLPGFPAGLIMPLAGMWAAGGEISFLKVMLLSVVAGLMGSWILYLLGRLGGNRLMDFFLRKFPRKKPLIEQKMELIKEKGSVSVFISKLMPVVRTIISIPAGMVKLNFIKYTVSSVLGVFIWNLVFVGAGYFFGDAAIKMLT